MNYKYFVISLLFIAHHTSSPMQPQSITTTRPIPKHAFAPSGLTLQEDENNYIKILEKLPPLKGADTDFQALSKISADALAALIQYTHNPALEPKLAKSNNEIGINRLIAIEKIKTLILLNAKADFMLSPEGQQMLQKEKEREKKEFKSLVFKSASVGASVVGAVLVMKYGLSKL